MKKLMKYKWLFAGVVWLITCYFIGQAINGHKEVQLEASELPEPDVAHAKISEYDDEGNRIVGSSSGLTNSNATDNLGQYSISFDGVQSTEDNPWGYNAGIIDVDELGECALVTPNTALVLYGTDSLKKITLEAEIHPWMEELSDGVGLVVQYINEGGEIIEEISYSDIIKDKDTIQIENNESASVIKILCNNGNNNDDNGDWLIIWEN